MLFCRQEAVKGFSETLCQHLDGRCWDMLTMSLEGTLKFILARKCPIMGILCFEHFKHAVIDGVRLHQALHEQGHLHFIWVYPVLKCSHSNLLPHMVETVKGQGIPRESPRFSCPSRPRRKVQFTSMSQSQGHSCAVNL